MNLLKTKRFENGQITPSWEFYDSLNSTTKSIIDKCLQAIKNNRLIADRVAYLRKTALDNQFTIDRVAMGSGGVGSIKRSRKGIIIQIGCGYGTYNYAQVVVINPEL